MDYSLDYRPTLPTISVRPQAGQHPILCPGVGHTHTHFPTPTWLPSPTACCLLAYCLDAFGFCLCLAPPTFGFLLLLPSRLPRSADPRYLPFFCLLFCYNADNVAFAAVPLPHTCPHLPSRLACLPPALALPLCHCMAIPNITPYLPSLATLPAFLPCATPATLPTLPAHPPWTTLPHPTQCPHLPTLGLAPRTAHATLYTCPHCLPPQPTQVPHHPACLPTHHHHLQFYLYVTTTVPILPHATVATPLHTAHLPLPACQHTRAGLPCLLPWVGRLGVPTLVPLDPTTLNRSLFIGREKPVTTFLLQ